MESLILLMVSSRAFSMVLIFFWSWKLERESIVEVCSCLMIRFLSFSCAFPVLVMNCCRVSLSTSVSELISWADVLTSRID